MGLPIEKLVVCTNQNDVLHRFFESGEYKKIPSFLTIAPSMDISISSNFERYLFYLADENPETLKSWMDTFENTGSIALNDLLPKAKQEFLSSATDKSQIVETMKNVFITDNYLLCPHTATAAFGVKQLNLTGPKTVILATAHPAKFEEAEALALPIEKIPTRPKELEELFGLPTRKTLLPTDLSQVQSFIRSKLV